MQLLLKSHGRTFATRARASQLLPVETSIRSPSLLIDFSAVLVSPSFVAELLSRAATRYEVISLRADSDELRAMLSRLVAQLSLETVVVERPGSVVA